MCGRFAQTGDFQKIRDEFHIVIGPDVPRLPFNYNCAPGQDIYAIVMVDTEGIGKSRELKVFKWGLLTEWMFRQAPAGPKNQGHEKPGAKPAVKSLINVRDDTLLLKKTFLRQFKDRRCIIFADGFYEWSASPRPSGTPLHDAARHREGNLTKDESPSEEMSSKTPGSFFDKDTPKKGLAQKSQAPVKTPYYFYMKDRRPFGLAGIWNLTETPEKTVASCAIITTGPNELISPVHNRMPVILPAERWDAWLDVKNVPPAEAGKLFLPFDAGLMQAHEVSRRVNSPDNNDPDIIVPVVRSTQSVVHR